MGKGIIAEPQAVWAFVRELRRYAGELDGNTAKMLSRLADLHGSWRDSKYDHFSDDMKKVAKEVKRARTLIEEYAKHLDGFAQKVDEAEKHRITGR